MSSQRGLNHEELSAIAEFRGSALFTEREKIALEYAEEMCKTPVSVPDQLFGRLRRVFTEDEILELTATIALENFLARRTDRFRSFTTQNSKMIVERKRLRSCGDQFK